MAGMFPVEPPCLCEVVGRGALAPPKRPGHRKVTAGRGRPALRWRGTFITLPGMGGYREVARVVGDAAPYNHS